MADKLSDKTEATPEPGSAEDLFPDAEPADDLDKNIRDKGEPAGGENFA